MYKNLIISFVVINQFSKQQNYYKCNKNRASVGLICYAVCLKICISKKTILLKTNLLKCKFHLAKFLQRVFHAYILLYSLMP